MKLNLGSYSEWVAKPGGKHTGHILCLVTPRHIHFAFCLKIVHEGMNLGAKQAGNFSSKSSLLQFIFSLLSLCWTVTKDSFIMQLSFPYFCTNHFLFVMFRAPSFPPSHRNRDDYIKCGSLFSLFLDCKTCNYLTLFFINFMVFFFSFFVFWLNVARHWLKLARPMW